MPSRSGRTAHLVSALLALALACGCAAWKRFQYEGPGRDDWQKPEEVVALLGIDPGDRVADLGAGGGYFTFRLAETVGPQGRVYAVDVDDDLLDYLAERVEEQGWTQVEVVRATPEDPRLPEGEIDLVFLSNTYHHLEDRPDYFRRLLRDLAPNGRVAIVELDERAGGLTGAIGHFTSVEQIEREMGEAGYERVAEHPILDRQSFLIFRPDDGTGE